MGDGDLRGTVRIDRGEAFTFKVSVKGSDVKPKPHKVRDNSPAEPAGIRPPFSQKPFGQVTSEWLDEVSAGTEENIRDTPAWKEAVRCLGLSEARRRLRLGCLASQCPAPSPDN